MVVVFFSETLVNS